MKLRDFGMTIFLCFIIYGGTLMYIDKRIEDKIDEKCVYKVEKPRAGEHVRKMD